MNLGADSEWTIFLVWSRPNWRQSSPTSASMLLSIGGVAVLAADNNGADQLVLFPGAQQTVLSGALTRRHTHAVILRNTPGSGVDVWLDASRAADAAPNPLATTLSAPLLFLHDGAAGGGAECWFHEAACWNHALTGDNITAILSYETRWTLGARKGIQVLVTGQSNAGNGLNDGRLAFAGTGRRVAPRRPGLWRGRRLRQPAGRDLHPWRGPLSGSGPRPEPGRS